MNKPGMETDRRTFAVNWLFVLLVAVSMAVHGLILLRLPGVPVAVKPVSIPVTLRKIAGPPVRAIPKPPVRPPFSGDRKPRPSLTPDRTEPSIAPVPELSGHITPVEIPTPEKPALVVPEPVAPASSPAHVPDRPSETVGNGPPTAASTTGGSLDARMMDYFNEVRRKIESRKKYPEASRRQQAEGKVVVAFVINPDGTVSDLTVAEGSGFAALDAAALAAVHDAAPFKPLPEGHLKGSALVKVPILFEMIR